jgi:plastocyanin
MIFLLILSTFTLFSLVVGTSFADVSIQINGDGAPTCEQSNSCFSISDAKISTGEQITWINSSPVTHSISSGNPYEGPDGSFEFNLNSGESTTFKFSSVGQYPYFCMVHP